MSSFYGLTIYFILTGFLWVFLFWSSLLCLFLPFFYSLNYFAHGGVSGDLIYWCRILGLFPSPRTESLMLVILTIFYFCSLYLRFNKNLPAIHCHFFPTGSCLFLRGCCVDSGPRESGWTRARRSIAKGGRTAHVTKITRPLSSRGPVSESGLCENSD